MSEPSTPPRPWYRCLRLRISIRSLIVLVLIIGGGLGWIVHRARVQREAVVTIEEAGGLVFYDFQRTDYDIDPPTPPPKPWPEWVMNIIGIDYLSDVVSASPSPLLETENKDKFFAAVTRLRGLKSLGLVYDLINDDDLVHLRDLTRLRDLTLSSSALKGPGFVYLVDMKDLRVLDVGNIPASDSDLAALGKLNQLESLRLGGPNITDAGLTHLRGLDLRKLSLWKCQISPRGLAQAEGLSQLESLLLDDLRVDDLQPLQALKRLERLRILNTQLTDESLGPLKKFRGLKWFGIDSPQITDAGMIPLQSLTGLTYLSLNNAQITDSGLARLAGLTKLETLVIGGTKITDAGLVHLAGMKNLSRVDLLFTSITDAGLAHFSGLKNIEYLNLCGTNITDAGLVHLGGMKGDALIDLSATGVTPTGVASLKKAAPRMLILP